MAAPLPSGVSNLKNDQRKVSQMADFCSRSFYNIKTSSHSPCSRYKWEQPSLLSGAGSKVGLGLCHALAPWCVCPSSARGRLLSGTPVICRHHTPVLQPIASCHQPWVAGSEQPPLLIVTPGSSSPPWPVSSFRKKRGRHLSTSLPIA